jgi:hypothetical protein
MRILLTHHFPLFDTASGGHTQRLAIELLAAGHEVRCLIVDRGGAPEEAFPVRRVVCGPAAKSDLPFAVPYFRADLDSRSERGASFSELSDPQMVLYRDVLRVALDEEIESFDPHMIHCQHVWVQGHLALEAGVPYVLTAWGPELAEVLVDERYARLAQEAAENAGRVIAPTSALSARLHETFGDLEDRLTVLPAQLNSTSALGSWFAEIYREVLTTRFGPGIRP